ncbi:uncharacterized protein TEOVI_000887300 [Trypanosoma equiperdum]|uniref:RRM domain-containing protein n=1 Tax=Trypanosoma equiperdum TaxID=5694 RepID=A0A1G4I312_TRYEQ|nr:hypothetical protein, conserved [Trypanosoma equiperdum]
MQSTKGTTLPKQRPASTAPLEATKTLMPLHELPSFRRDLLSRSVFVLGLRTTAEMRELLSLMKRHCGIITGAFRVADFASGGMSTGGSMAVQGTAVDSRSALSNAGGCVVVCLTFRTEEGAHLAQRMDNTALVYGSRFVVLPATRFHQNISQVSSKKQRNMPQHERLWQLLFSPTVGGSNIDWAAAAGAVNRGELLMLHPSDLPVDVTSDGTSSGGGASGAAYMKRQVDGGTHSTGDDDKFRLSHYPAAAAPADDLNGARNFSTTPATTTAVTAPVPLYTPRAAVDTENLGRSNTLQQQYYNDVYESSRTPFLSTVSDIASSILTSTGSGNTEYIPRVGRAAQQTDLYGSPPLRQRVEPSRGQPLAERVTAHSQRLTVEGNETESRTNNVTTNSVYIPRVHSLGSLVMDALPFASSLISTLLRAVSSPSQQHLTADATAGYERINEGEAEESRIREMLGMGDWRDARGRKRMRHGEDAHGTPVRYISSRGNEVAGTTEEKFYNFEGGFTTLSPDVLNTRFSPSGMAAVPMTVDGGEAGGGVTGPMGSFYAAGRRHGGGQDLRRSLLHAMMSAASLRAQGNGSGVGNDNSDLTASAARSDLPLPPVPDNASNEEVREYIMRNVRLLPAEGQRQQQMRYVRGTDVAAAAAAATTTPAGGGSSFIPFVSAVSSLFRRVNSVWRG